MAQATNTWAPPVQHEVSAVSAATAPPPYYQVEPASGGQRVCFWIAAGCAWGVWALAVTAATAAAHDEWVYERIESSSTEIWLGDGNFLDFCDEADKFDVDDTYEAQCLLYRWFVWTQYIATAMCSIAVAALALAAFLPAVVGCCAWVKSLAVAGGVFMFGYVVFQLAAAVLVYFFVEVSEKIANDILDEFETTFGDNIEVEYGFRTTFWLAAVGLVLGFFTAVFLLCCCCYAGNGPLYCCGDDEGCCGGDGGNAKRGHTTYHV